MWKLPQSNRFLVYIFVALVTQFLLIFLLISCYNAEYSFAPVKAYILVKMGRTSSTGTMYDFLKIQNKSMLETKSIPALNSEHGDNTERIDLNIQIPEKDYSQLINLRNFKFTLVNNHGCSTENTSKNPFLLILVVTSPSNHDRRKIVRQTWGNVTDDDDTKLVFLMAAVDGKSQKLVDEENEKYKDIAQGNFLDSYRNLTYKTVMSLKYVIYHCPFTKYVLKIDDDSFVNMPLLKHFLKNQISPSGANNLLICDVLVNKKPYRNPNSKWYVSTDDYPEEHYPTYCPGWVAIFTPDTVFRLYRAAQETEYFWLEDVFLYGIVAGKVPNLKHTDMTGLTTTWYYADQLLQHKYGNLTFLFGGPDFNNQLMIDFWRYVQENNELMFKKIDTIWKFIQGLSSLMNNSTDYSYKTFAKLKIMASANFSSSLR